MLLWQIWYSYDLSSFPTLVSVVQSLAATIQPVFNVVFLGKGEEGSICNEQCDCMFKSFDSDVHFS